MSLPVSSPFLNWNSIDTVFLDMDGTLLDLNYDNQFWQKYLPECYAKQHNLSLEAATESLMSRYKDMSGTLEWYCVDYWTTQLDMDVGALKKDLAHLIAIHPYVPEFLQALHQHHKRVVLVTNAHHKSLSLKMQHTQLGEHFDRIVCAHDLGLPKEAGAFWHKLQTIEPFNVARTLFIDDSLPVLRSAANYGITYLLSIYQPDSQSSPNEVGEFRAIRCFREIMPKH
ncbi:MAG: GMP/IMP nucleotidase [Gammaproteobacteria bacterium]|nr:MAG: GMP/IMP nucleotidase [Gammaproteobacteria bacterium]RKZ44591.1 MAG: GMP/IMP nucleotidase [Gammaproteobacteria bacterium]RKZ76793.1 MAG: GMP/IMP nucleotidase [Gammaproteobacteria bacterium]